MGDDIFECADCSAEFYDEMGYTVCEDCGCPKVSAGNDACYLSNMHDGPCEFTLDPLVTDEEIADALASIGRAAKIPPGEMGMLTYG